MQISHRSPFLTIHTEGALLPVDLLQRILASDKDLPGLTPEDYHLSGEKINEAINRSWNRLQGAWAAFETSRSRLNPGDPGTTLTRERWLLPLFQELGYGRLQTAKAIEIEGKSYAISHTWGTAELPTPIHLVGCGVDIEKRQAGVSGASRSSPHSLMQELLNRDETRLWGIVSNGLRLRVLRDNASLTRQAFVEFDLEAIFSGEIYADFAVLWLACHQSRLEGDKPEVQWLERWSQVAQEQGTRALEGLRSGVEEAIVALGQGFLSHPANQAMRQQLKSGKLDRQQYFRQLLRLVYRLIFLFVAEERDLLLLPDAAPEAKERYLKYYSTTRLRRLAERQRGGRHADLWQGLKLLTDLLAGNIPGGREIGLPVLGGFLFSHKALPDLETAQVDNQALLTAVRSLAFTQEKNSRRAVDYKNLGSEELGSVYESLLELQPVLNVEAGAFQLTTAAGNERKTSGSYYTNAGLIKITLDSALDPVMAQAILGAGGSVEMQIAALLALKICDPACGSGHFLIAAARRIARRLAQLRSGDEEPSPSMIRHALREVIAHCIYGVDINPMAVELCKVNLWLEALEPGKPLTFLDAHIKCGNSLVGVGPGMDVYDLVIPDEAFEPVTGDDKKVAAALKKRNKEERKGQLTFDMHSVWETPADDCAARARLVETMPEDTPEQVASKEAAYATLQSEYEAQKRRLLADLWTAAFFWRLQPDPNAALAVPTQGEWRNARLGKPSVGLAAEAGQMSAELRFFHWPLEFPDVFDQGGFACVLGNPPWEKINLRDEEFFSQSHPEIANAKNKSVREKLIENLRTTFPSVYQAYSNVQAFHDNLSNYFRASNSFPLTGISRINLYSVFAEISLRIICPKGRTGLVIASGIATDDNNKALFEVLISNHRLICVLDFENREALFPAVHRMYKFCLFCAGGKDIGELETDFVFNLTKVEQLKIADRHFTLTYNDIKGINPITKTVPIFRTRFDAEIVKSIYKRIPVWCLSDSKNEKFGIPKTPFNMSNDSGLFQAKQKVLDSGGILKNDGCLYLKDIILLPLYESKLIHQFNHRYATFSGVDDYQTSEGNASELSLFDLQNPNKFVEGRYWLNEALLIQRFPGKWFLVFRDVTNASNERTVIGTIIPGRPCGHSLVLLDVSNSSQAVLLIAMMNSIVFDYIARQKTPGLHLNQWIWKQLPVLPSNDYTPADIDFITPRVLEMVYTAYDLKPFAEDMGYNGEPFRWDEGRRALLRAELDAYYARLYGLTRDELRYILDPQDVYGPDFPGETFRVLKEKEIKRFGEYRTRRLVLEAWDRLDGVEAVKVQPMAKIEKLVVMEQLAPVKEIYALPAKEKAPRTVREKAAQATPEQPAFSDFGLYKCGACGKMVMGFDRENHARDVHKGKGAEWKKV